MLCQSMNRCYAFSLSVAFTVMLVAAVFTHAAAHWFGLPRLHVALQVSQWVAVALTGLGAHRFTCWALRR